MMWKSQRTILFLLLLFCLFPRVSFSEDTSQDPVLEKMKLQSQLSKLKTISSSLLQELTTLKAESQPQAEQLTLYSQQLQQVSNQLKQSREDLTNSQINLKTVQEKLTTVSNSLDNLTAEFQSYKRTTEKTIARQKTIIKILIVALPCIFCGGMIVDRLVPF